MIINFSVPRNIEILGEYIQMGNIHTDFALKSQF